jgi:hypothetical protein
MPGCIALSSLRLSATSTDRELFLRDFRLFDPGGDMEKPRRIPDRAFRWSETLLLLIKRWLTDGEPR